MGRWPWKLEPANECVITHQPSQFCLWVAANKKKATWKTRVSLKQELKQDCTKALYNIVKSENWIMQSTLIESKNKNTELEMALVGLI